MMSPTRHYVQRILCILLFYCVFLSILLHLQPASAALAASSSSSSSSLSSPSHNHTAVTILSQIEPHPPTLFNDEAEKHQQRVQHLAAWGGFNTSMFVTLFFLFIVIAVVLVVLLFREGIDLCRTKLHHWLESRQQREMQRQQQYLSQSSLTGSSARDTTAQIAMKQVNRQVHSIKQQHQQKRVSFHRSSSFDQHDIDSRI